MTENTRDSLFPSPGFRVASLLAIIMLASPGLTAAASLSDTASPLARAGDPGFAEMRPRQSRPQPQQERETGSWALTLDNDMLVPGTRDQDYTYGLSMAATGTRAHIHI